MNGNGIKNINYQASFYQNYDFGRPQTTSAIMSPYPSQPVSIPLDANFLLSNHLQKPINEQDKYHDIYCNPSMYGGLYPDTPYSNDVPVHLVSPEWRQAAPQPNWDIKMDSNIVSEHTSRSVSHVNEQYFRKSGLDNSSCPNEVGSSDYHPVEGFSRNSIKGSQYYYSSVGFGNMESSDNSSFSSLSPKMSLEMTKTSKDLTELVSNQNEFDKLKKTHIKKPLNAFMLFMKEMRSRVVAECTLKESAAINQILGRRWHALTREEQTKYYEMARKEKELHQQLYPNWSARDNYASHTKRKKKRTNTIFQMSYFNHGNCFKNSHHVNGHKFQTNSTDPSMTDQNSLVISNKRGLLSNRNFFYKPDSSYHIDPLLALHYGSSFSEKLAFSNNQGCLNSNWSTPTLTDHQSTFNKDCLLDVQIGSTINDSRDRLQNDPGVPLLPIPDEGIVSLEITDNNACRKPHLVSESVF